MHCPRLDHFVRFNSNGTVSRCGHMVNPPQYKSLEMMEASSWLANTKELMKFDHWPKECVRCQETEPDSIRMYALELDSRSDNKVIFKWAEYWIICVTPPAKLAMKI